MRDIGDKIGAPAATVSQVEKGERALKEPKIAAWATALRVDEADLHGLWLLSQGLIPAGAGGPVFYGNRPMSLFEDPLRDGLVPALEEGPDLEPIYRVAERIVAVLRRLLPDVSIWVRAQQFEAAYVLDAEMGTITPAQEDETEMQRRPFSPCRSSSSSGLRRAGAHIDRTASGTRSESHYCMSSLPSCVNAAAP